MGGIPSDERASALVVRHANVVDPVVRVQALRSDLATLSSEEIVDLVETVALAADAGVTSHRELLLILAVSLADPSFAEQKAAAADLATSTSRSIARALLL